MASGCVEYRLGKQRRTRDMGSRGHDVLVKPASVVDASGADCKYASHPVRFSRRVSRAKQSFSSCLDRQKREMPRPTETGFTPDFPYKFSWYRRVPELAIPKCIRNAFQVCAR